MAATQIQTMKPTHDAILDHVLAAPHQTLAQLSQVTGYSVSWLCQIMKSDCFRAAYDARRGDIEAQVMMPLQEKLTAAAELAIEKVQEELVKSKDKDFILDAFDKVLHRAGYAPSRGPVGVVHLQQNNVYTVTREELAEMRQTIVATPVRVVEALPADEQT